MLRLLASGLRDQRAAGSLGTGLLLLLLSWTAGGVTGERLMFHPQRADIGPPPSAHGWAYRDVSFKDSAGLTLRGWWIPGTNGKTVVMLHGWTSSRREAYDKSAYLHEAGYNVLVFDFRGHGRSDGPATTIGWLEPDDVRAAVRYARSLAPGPIALIGYSMGGAIALEEAGADPRVSCVVVDSAFSDLDGVAANLFRARTQLPFLPFGALTEAMARIDLGERLADVRPVAAGAELHKPLLAIVGSADALVPPSNGEAIYRSAPGPKGLLVVAGAGHTGAYYADPARYERTVLAFLDRSLNSAIA